MQIVSEVSLRYFEFWGGALRNAAMLSSEQLDEIEENIEDIFGGSPVHETTINDLFWFDFDYVLSLIGLEYEDLEEL